MAHIDLNCDLGESYGPFIIGHDEDVFPYISSANVACGFHGGDPMVMRQTIELAKRYGVQVGAHPGYPDLNGFGRRAIDFSSAEIEAMVLYQIGALAAMCTAAGVPLVHVKAHGALYNRAMVDASCALALCQAVRALTPELIMVGQPGSQLQKAAGELNLVYRAEIFADRAYNDDGTLVSRSKPGAMIDDQDEMLARVVRMIKDHEVVSIQGHPIAVQADTLCVHGDGEHASAFVKSLRERFAREDIEVQGLMK